MRATRSQLQAQPSRATKRARSPQRSQRGPFSPSSTRTQWTACCSPKSSRLSAQTKKPNSMSKPLENRASFVSDILDVIDHIDMFSQLQVEEKIEAIVDEIYSQFTGE